MKKKMSVGEKREAKYSNAKGCNFMHNLVRRLPSMCKMEAFSFSLTLFGFSFPNGSGQII